MQLSIDSLNADSSLVIVTKLLVTASEKKDTLGLLSRLLKLGLPIILYFWPTSVDRICELGSHIAFHQVSVHLRLADEQGKTTLASECFECQPKAAPKSYPVCTIRNTPDKPIHCIVWAKDLLFQRLFGR